jgi:hypothetical protein
LGTFLSVLGYTFVWSLCGVGLMFIALHFDYIFKVNRKLILPILLIMGPAVWVYVLWVYSEIRKEADIDY